VVVVATVVVAALVNGNDDVTVMDTVDESQRSGQSGRYGSQLLHFQKLDVYQLAIEFLVPAQRVRRRLPRGHTDLADQLRRSALSIP
jgi:hypothetical protein